MPHTLRLLVGLNSLLLGRDVTIKTNHGRNVTGHGTVVEDKPAEELARATRFFLFYFFLKIKISKIYVFFEIFQNYPPVAPP